MIAILASLLASGCSSETEPTGEDGDFSFATGEFNVQTYAVDDRCLDGGLNLLFMPNGEEDPWDWPYPITVYEPEQLTMSYAITLRDPFGEMEVTASETGTWQQELAIHLNPSVALGQDRFGECVVEMGGHGDVTIVDADHAQGTIFLELSNPRGDDRCPADMAEQCEVHIGFFATRADGT